MQQAALNLLAIGIFAVTVTTLLGPLVDIPPLLPAGATFGALVALTADRFAWDGKGTLLLLDSFATPEQRDRVLHHEAGHFLAAYFLGVPITGYTLTAWESVRAGQPGAGGVRFDTSALEDIGTQADRVALLVDRFSTVWMAGIAAELETYGTAEGGSDDCANLRAVLQPLGFAPQACDRKQRWAQLQARSLLQRHADAYQALVAAMAERASVETCCAAIQQHCQTV